MLSDKGNAASRSLVTVRTRDSPLWHQARAAGMAVRAARERTFCRTREPAGVLEMLAWSPAVQKAAGLLSRSCRNRREQDPDVVGKLQLATPESREYFLEMYC
jgi:hypothetical protein